jgi:hypothetical protein
VRNNKLARASASQNYSAAPRWDDRRRIEMKTQKLFVAIALIGLMVLSACGTPEVRAVPESVPTGTAMALELAALQTQAAQSPTPVRVANCVGTIDPNGMNIPYNVPAGSTVNYPHPNGESTDITCTVVGNTTTTMAVTKHVDGRPYTSAEISALLTATAQPIATPRATYTPRVIATATAGSIMNGYETFTYEPGGESFGKTATDVTLPSGETDCFRVWQATNLKNIAWTAIFCNWQASNPAPKQQWPHPMQLTVSETGTIEFDLYRDFADSGAYDVANAQNSPLGLGWFVQGFNGSVCVNGDCQDLSGGGVFQMSFPKNWRGHYHIKITANNGQVQFWQGERATSTDNWPLP